MADVQFVDPIPVDILLEIFLRLPAKSLGRFVCVSKLWETLIRDEDFIRSFSFRSSSKKHPQLLLSFYNQIKNSQEIWHFFSKSTLVSTPLLPPREPALGPRGLTSQFVNRVARRNLVSIRKRKRRALLVDEPKVKVREEDISIPPDFLSSIVCHLKKWRYINPSYAYGLISFLNGDEQVVSNPTTGKSITLPTPSFESTEMIVRSFLGYDPINAQYKVLCLTNVKRFCEFQVFTLGSSQTQNWRMIHCSTPHSALGTSSVCIDGVLYYTASTSFSGKEPFLAGFDLRSETLEVVSMFPEGFGSRNLHEASLINCHGKVALVIRYKPRAFRLWVLENANKQEWSELNVSLARFNIGKVHGVLELLGTSDIGEFIFAPTRFEELNLHFLDQKSNRIKSIQLQGSTNHNFRDFYGVFTFLDHVESLMFI